MAQAIPSLVVNVYKCSALNQVTTRNFHLLLIGKINLLLNLGLTICGGGGGRIREGSLLLEGSLISGGYYFQDLLAATSF